MFSIYSEPICDITHKHGIKIHLYADDTRLHLSFVVYYGDMSECVKKMKESLREIRYLVSKNMLKHSDDKTEVLVISTPPPFSLIDNMKVASELVM